MWTREDEGNSVTIEVGVVSPSLLTETLSLVLDAAAQNGSDEGRGKYRYNFILR